MRKYLWFVLALLALVISIVSPSISASFYTDGQFETSWQFVMLPLGSPIYAAIWVIYSAAILASIGAVLYVRTYDSGIRGTVNAWLIATAIPALALGLGMMVATARDMYLSATDVLRINFFEPSMLWQHGIIGLGVLALAAFARWVQTSAPVRGNTSVMAVGVRGMSASGNNPGTRGAEVISIDDVRDKRTRRPA